jgi:hypothetical protein
MAQGGSGFRQLAENIPSEMPMFVTSPSNSMLLKWMAG